MELEKKNHKKITPSEAERFMDVKGISITGSDGAKTKNYIIGYDLGKSKNGYLFVGFTPKESDHDFQLTWPGNPSLSLGK